MKKIFTLFWLSALFLFTLFGCQNVTTTSTNATITLSETAITMAEGAKYQIQYELNFENTDGTVVTYESDNETVATVSALGEITAVDAGVAQITIAFGTSLSASLSVTVSDEYVIVAPRKTIYKAGENLALAGAALEIYDSEDVLLETIAVTAEMIVTYDPQKTGTQLVGFSYQGITYNFEIYILNEKQAVSLFDDFIVLNQTSVAGEKIEFALTKSNLVAFLDTVNNVYDYNEIDIYGLFQSPSGKSMKVSAFWYQNYQQNAVPGVIDPKRNLEGTVNNLSDDYDLILSYIKDSDPQYRMRFLASETGTYQCTLVVKVDGAVIQTFVKEFVVSADPLSDYEGVIEVDATSNSHFVFSEGGSYIPVGQNVAWYTSGQRKYYDYKSWFGKMGEVGMNYARVWMAVWGYSIFWDDVYNYDARQSNMTSLDETINLAEENGIYIQLCLLHHGMFSALVNPMWPGSTNTWYTAKYGSNPYAEYLDNSGLFFTQTEAKNSFKNQLDYIVARWGYSDHIMSWELFNEVDWIETYTAVSGTAWHEEMASYLKSIDPYGHMVTTSVKSDSFLSNIYQVFALEEIDYVNVHSYGIYNHTTTLPTKQNNGWEIFNKPVLYDEVGYSGNGGADQYSKDPNNVTLHQALWAGALGNGAGTAMNWWWESWIETYDCYDVYAGIAAYSDLMNLTGSDFRVLAATDGTYNDATMSNTVCEYMGYVVDNRVYAYLYDRNYTLNNQTVSAKSNVTFTVPSMASGSYNVSFYNTVTGVIISTSTIQLAANGNLSVIIPTFTADIAVIIAPNA